MRLGDWLRVASRNRFRIHPFRWPMALAIGAFGLFNTVCAWLATRFYGKAVAETQIQEPPIFILGHWRSGTTFLHELLSLDDRFCSPTTYQCLAPTHFLMTEWWVTRWFWWISPSRRPMDNMESGLNRPQEDEFALQNLGAPSPYQRMAFPNHPAPYLEYLDMEGVSVEDRRRWKEILVDFAKAITLRYGKPIVFKSPPHTGRVATLLEAFPEAKFLHIVRDPYELFASTLRLWRSLDEVQGLQLVQDQGREEYVFAAFERMYRGFEQQRHLIPAGRLYEIRYEDLVADPLAEMRNIYEKLGLGGFENVLPKLEAYLTEHRDYRRNQHALSAEVREQINQRWAGYFERYGYAMESA